MRLTKQPHCSPSQLKAHLAREGPLSATHQRLELDHKVLLLLLTGRSLREASSEKQAVTNSLIGKKSFFLLLLLLYISKLFTRLREQSSCQGLQLISGRHMEGSKSIEHGKEGFTPLRCRKNLHRGERTVMGEAKRLLL